MPEVSQLVIPAHYRPDKETGDGMRHAPAPTGGKLAAQMRGEYRCQEYLQFLGHRRTILAEPKLNKRARRLLILSEAEAFRNREWCCNGCQSAGRKLPKWLAKPAAKKETPRLRLVAGSAGSSSDFVR